MQSPTEDRDHEAVRKERKCGVGISGRRCSCLLLGGHPPPPQALPLACPERVDAMLLPLRS